MIESTNKLISKYNNGNYEVKLYSDGTKIRRTNEDEFIPSFAESIDMMITDYCDGNCKYCYAGCSTQGHHCDFDKYEKLLESIHPYTELAINGNDLSHPQLHDFLKKMKDQKVIVNMTVNQKHFIDHLGEIDYYIRNDLIHGLGVSLKYVDNEFLKCIEGYNNLVIHVINGIVTLDDLYKLSNRNLKLLILGYKQIDRGEFYYNNHYEEIINNQDWLRIAIKSFYNKFSVISFDNLSLEQLDIKSTMSENDWNKFFMGNDAEYTFYIDLVNGTYSESSLSKNHYKINSNNIDDLFKFICKFSKLEE